MRSMKLAAFLGLALLAACSEGPLPTDDVAATQFIGEVSASFQAVQPMLHRSLAIEQQGDGFKPIVPAQLERIAPGRWRKPGPHKLDVEWPKEANGVMRLSSGPVTIEVRPVGARAVAGAAVERALVYRDNYQGASSFHVAEVDRVEEFIVLRDETTPRVFEWDVSVVRGGGRVRQNAGVVEVLDGKGVAWLRSARPWVVDGAGEKREVEATLIEGKLSLPVPEQANRYPVLLDPGWTTTGSMAVDHEDTAAALLPSGKVLIAGGFETPISELYEPNTGTWTTTGSLGQWRCCHSATLLNTGKVLVAGGMGGIEAVGSSAEIFDPATGTWTPTGSLLQARYLHTATILGNGNVLVAGGETSPPLSTTAEQYDPNTGLWTTTGAMAVGRFRHTATLLVSGKVLVVGGEAYGYGPGGLDSLDSAELFDPITEIWTATGDMAEARRLHTANLLASGKVLISGGESYGSGGNGVLSSAELFDPIAGIWMPTGSMAEVRMQHSATVLSSGKVVVAGGSQDSGITNSSEVFDPSVGTWSTTGSTAGYYCAHTANLLVSGQVLVAGGHTGGPSAELYDPTTGNICKNSSSCLSGFCVEGICCETACQETCKECVVQNGVGRCVNVAVGMEDPNASVPCTGTKRCDGEGSCKNANGQPCTAGAECAGGICADGVCCESECTETCFTCNVAGKEGLCHPVPVNMPDANATTACGNTNACDGQGACKLGFGQACYNSTECASGHCIDDFCCDTACDKDCESCSISGAEGTCSPIAANTDPDGECIGIDPACGGACNGARQCEFPGIGTTCGLCKACDGTGRCNSVPSDDEACGVIDCDELDTACRDYEDIKTDRCASFGVCKEANVAVTCTQFTELACGDAGVAADAGVADAAAVGNDSGAKVLRGDDAGCSCDLGYAASKDASLPLLYALFVLGLALARRREGRPL